MCIRDSLWKQKLAGHIPVAERQSLRTDNLIFLMAFTGDQDGIAGVRFRQRLLNRLPPILSLIHI